MFLTDTTSSVTISTLTSTATEVLTWLLSAATKICDFMLGNPLCAVFIGISLAFVGFRVVGRVLHR